MMFYIIPIYKKLSIDVGEHINAVVPDYRLIFLCPVLRVMLEVDNG